MFVAIRDLRFARGRFLLIGTVVALITILAGFLSGLTGGLASQSVSAILALPGDRLVFSAAPEGSSSIALSDSAVTKRQADAWASVQGVVSVSPIGISQTRAEHGAARMGIAVFGVEPGSGSVAPSKDGHVGLSQSVATGLGVTHGDLVTIAGTDFRVENIHEDRWYSHTPVAEMTLNDWQDIANATGSQGAYATVLAVSGDPDWASAASQTRTSALGTIDALMTIGAFKSEIGSLLLIVSMLFGISALVIGAFFTVWTMQRKGDIAVLKALGASTRSLMRDALGQAFIVLLAGIGSGIGIVALLGTLAKGVLPFLLSPLTTVVPGVIMIAVGLAGAAFALRSVTFADPLTALGSNR